MRSDGDVKAWLNGDVGKRLLLHTCRNAEYRCSNPRMAGYRNYGGRGIKFLFGSPLDAAKWIYETIGPRPNGMQLDRIDNSGHYESGNLRWASREEQNRNRRAFTWRTKTIYEYSTFDLAAELRRRGFAVDC